jgi:hypothetical protein
MTAMLRFPQLTAMLLAPFTALLATDPTAPQKDLPVPGEVFMVAGHTAFVIPGKTDPTGKSKRWVWYAPTLPGLPGRE